MTKKNVNPDNLYVFRVCGEDLECIASLGASDIYKEEFIGELPSPYTGVLETDLGIIHRRTLRTVNVMLNEDGEVAIGDDGTPVEVPDDYEGAKKAAPNPDYFGRDIVAVLRFVWAMAYAAGSTAEGWGTWSERVLRSSMSMHAQKRIFEKALYEVALKHWFLDEEGLVGAEEQDEEG